MSKKKKEQVIEWHGMYFSPRFAAKVLPFLEKGMGEYSKCIEHCDKPDVADIGCEKNEH